MIQDLADLLAAVAWPTAAVIALFVLRRPLASFIEDLGKRATKISLLQFAVELKTATEEPPRFTLQADPTPASKVPSDSSSQISAILTEPTKTDCAVVSLGTGDQWLASRLFLLAALMPRLHGLRSFVFVETRGDVRDRFVGIAEARSVRWRLAHQYPWFETEFAKAYAGQAPLSVPADYFGINRLVNEFLATIQKPKPPTEEKSRWVPVPKSGAGYYEKSMWLDSERLETDLGDALQTESFVVHAPDEPATKRAQAVLRRQGPFVPILNAEHQFMNLINRESLLEAAARQLANVET